MVKHGNRSTASIAAAAILGAAVFAIDLVSNLDASVSILYLAPLALFGWRSRNHGIQVAAVVCASLSISGWMLAHGSAPDLASALRLVFGLIGIGITAALLVSRNKLQRLQSELELSRIELENFTDSVPQLLWRALPDRTVDFFNKRYTDLIGHDRREAIDRQNWGQWFHPEDLPAFQDAFAAAIASESDLRFDFRMMHADGSYRWMSLAGRCVRTSTPSGTVVRWYGGSSDAHDAHIASERIRELNETLEQRVEERTGELIRSQERYLGLFEVSNMTYAEMDFSGTQPVLDRLRERGITDLRGYMHDNPDEFAATLALIRTVRVNDALARLMGYANVADLVSNPPAMNAEDGPEVLLQQLEMAWNGTDHIEGRTVLTGKGGIEIPIYFTVARLPGGLHLSSHLDLTEQERIEGMRQAAQDELARANRVATVGAFSASIAHELNQPIASMVMDAQTGLRWLQRETPDRAAAERILERLSRTAQRVAGIVQRTRDSIAAGRRVTDSVDLCRLAAETRELLDREMRRADVQLEIQCDDIVPSVLGDRIDLQQVMVNLLTNAADATRDTGSDRKVTLRITTVEDGVAVAVIDTGPGVPEANIARLFQPFFTTKPNGVGMGLQICKSTVEAMGGELRLRNLPQGGAEFSFTLPVAAARQGGDGYAEPAGPTLV
jgi:PAS domain S-box-containing protein